MFLKPIFYGFDALGNILSFRRHLWHDNYLEWEFLCLQNEYIDKILQNFLGSSSLILLKSKIKDDDNNNMGCKNTTMCV
jgi:hypothetical protein